MNRIALLALVLAAGCDNQRPEERKLPGSAAPTTTGPTAPGSAAPAPAAAGSATAEAQGTGFAPFDNAITGTRPWVAADDQAGLVELHAVDDLSDRTSGKFTVDRRCGADAARIAETMGKRIAERARSGHDAPTCREEAGITSCYQPGLGEGDVGLELEYGKTGDTWRVIGAKTYAMGVTMDQQEARYTALLKESCK